MCIVKEFFDAPRYKWKQWPRDLVDALWDHYLRFFQFENENEQAKGRQIWEAHIKDNYRKFMHDLRDGAIRNHESLSASRDHAPHFMGLEVWRGLLEVWDSDKYKEKWSHQSANRASASFPHFSGLIPFDIRRQELVCYESQLREFHGDSEESTHQMDDPGLKIWKGIVGGVKSGRLAGRPREKWSSHGSSSSSYALQQKNEEVQRLREELEAARQEMSEQYAAQAAFNASQVEFMKMMTERYDVPIPIPTPPTIPSSTSEAPIPSPRANEE